MQAFLRLQSAAQHRAMSVDAIASAMILGVLTKGNISSVVRSPGSGDLGRRVHIAFVSSRMIKGTRCGHRERGYARCGRDTCCWPSFFDRWKFSCEAGWRAYCEHHNYDLIVLDEKLDTSPLAQGRSPAWQKCLIFRSPSLASYDRVVWIDADIAINPLSPPIVSDIPVEKIGVIDEHAYPTPETRQLIIKFLIEHWRSVNKRISDNWTSFLNPADWHAFGGLPRHGQHMIQTGVLVLSPRYHRELLEHVYNVYEDAGGVEMNYEMRPLSFEIQQNGLQHWIDNRFNALVGPLTLHSQLILKRLLLSDWEIAAFLKAEYARNYFLHFAGAHHLMKLLIGNGQDPSASKSLNRNASCPCGSGKRYKHCHGRYA